ncbi:hypothetical protein GCM10028806_27150 [Spirosoma terrae]|uniref:PQQ-binding-like beta-propeller repeat protein n=1 Tax=Spirosoma terrae TaxID=1968276 RepID=A0A6L9L9W4_9BACT|nr:PQQ-binding-like beta-propeller repeat protein [Spirosoma terrae]NDU97324.1 PQQ-binding-like beta-propeller repeat protein [Spirosoma terrae]
MNINVSSLLKSLVVLSFVWLIVWGCKKAEDTPVTPTVPVDEEVIPGKTVGYGVELLEQSAYEKLPLIAEPIVIPSKNGRIAKDPVLTATYDLSAKMPPVQNQGQQSSCTAWATAYAARSYFNTLSTRSNYLGSNGQLLPSSVFSPAFVYNQLNGGQDKGSYTYKALDLIKTMGVCTMADMVYKATDFLTQPTAVQKQNASNFKIKDWGRININTTTIKKFLYYDHPVIIGIIPDRNFKQLTQKDAQNEYIWKETANDGTSGHAMVIVGYDDGRKAFKVQNSWGQSWANKGSIWFSYDIIAEVVREAYVMVVDDKNIWTPPQVQTVGAKLESDGKITFSGRITSLGDAPIQGIGFCVSNVRSLPDVKSSVRTEGIERVPYPIELTLQLAADTVWYRAYAQTISGTVYGDTMRIVLNNRGGSTGALKQNTLFFDSGDFAYGFNAESGTLLWQSKRTTNSYSGRGGVYTNGMYVFGDTQLTGVDASTGAEKWVFRKSDVSGAIARLVTIGELVYYLTESTLYAIDAKSGILRWSLTASSLVQGRNVFQGLSLSVTNQNKLAVATVNFTSNSLSNLYVIDNPATGKGVSVLDNDYLSSISNPYFEDNLLIYNSGSGDQKALTLRPSPTLLWKNKEVAGSVTVSNNLVIGFHPTSKSLRGLNRSTGVKVWEYVPAEGDIQSSSWSASGRYAAMMVVKRTSAFGGDATVHVVDNTTGKLIWKQPLLKSSLSGILIAGNKVYAWDGEMNTYDIATGNKLWRSSISRAGMAEPTTFSVVTREGTFYYMPESGMR